MDGWVQDLWLVAIVDDVPDDEVRRWWNGHETPILDDLAETAPGVRLGTILTTFEVTEPDGPARRVFDLMFLRGTCPEEFDRSTSAPYVLPVLDDELRAALLAAFSSRPEDPVLAEVTPSDDLTEFLDRHQGARLATHSRAEAVRVRSQ
ncbi:hypothetical protein AB0M79_16760 [Polymorphospora sp. NPDC051019]|uniref:hypothetical protein n=1 Tax=Polymorphospora sp. NPDC051019 TaxID=3155725 RepID=UPI003430C833